ncbi:MAG: transcriptional regulator [Ignavibacteria bacterium GWB2_35_12]|nr:MAG: transcriptional regulator [Ignavibacteria bacterium GWB2_35_12]OGU89750.1 MAG: transcriptional regulator [Ignavibacteria bacterium RIFOXYA2_FULL_35_10]OGV24007.1 MAG: transcriptional regulator [Ignavibacteria bacterium RIFOXYC2_FULL_35_21]
MKEGDIILADIISSDGTFKKRPSLILKILPKYGDLLVCTISTQLHQYIEGVDLIIDNNSSDFRTSGLIKDSLIRTCYLSIIPKRFNEGFLGFISQKSYKLIVNRLSDYLKK